MSYFEGTTGVMCAMCSGTDLIAAQHASREEWMTVTRAGVMNGVRRTRIK